MTKVWCCPRCDRDFIVAGDAERDVCPWCRTTVEEKAGRLQPVAAPGPASPAAKPPDAAPSPTGPLEADQPASPPGAQTGGGIWWPYEYDPF